MPIFYIMVNGEKNDKPHSRLIMETAEQIVRNKKPTPPQSSRFYAIVAREYFDTTYTLKKSFQYSTSSLERILESVVFDDPQAIATGTRPKGEEYWVSVKAPFSPNAGRGMRFIIGDDFDYVVPPPPLYGSDDFIKSLAKVKVASDQRTTEESAAINFWGGVPGTEAPAGIWQNRLYDVSKKYHLPDRDYAYVQMVLAESVADAFTECWKVKYIYWTKRPDMVDKSIETAMPNPPFPGYVSGHSTISFAAATVMSAFFPEDEEIYFRDAEEAKNSRLWAGIHFPYDNEEGEKLGKEVGKIVIAKLDINALQ